MPLHDWAKADDGLFHDFHNTWLTHLKEALNAGLLPPGYFAMLDQRTGVYVPDILTSAAAGAKPVGGGLLVAEPRADAKQVARAGRRPRPQRRVMVRTARQPVAVVELVSRANTDRAKSVRTFVEKAADLIRGGVHVAVLDVLPPGRHDPGGMHPPIWRELNPRRPADRPPADRPPADRPLTLAGYRAASPVVAYLNYATVGSRLPDVPLYLGAEEYVPLPLEATYMLGYDRLPAPLKAELL